MRFDECSGFVADETTFYEYNCLDVLYIDLISLESINLNNITNKGKKRSK